MSLTISIAHARRPTTPAAFAKSVTDTLTGIPAEVRSRIVRLYGDRPRVELFARAAVDGWARWGKEAPQ